MSLSIQELERVAQLARLELDEQEKQIITEKLNAILQYVGKMDEIDTDHVEPTNYGLQLVNVMREDEVRPSLPIEHVLRNAPDEEDGQFKVPAILD